MGIRKYNNETQSWDKYTGDITNNKIGRVFVNGKWRIAYPINRLHCWMEIVNKEELCVIAYCFIPNESEFIDGDYFHDVVFTLNVEGKTSLATAHKTYTVEPSYLGEGKTVQHTFILDSFNSNQFKNQTWLDDNDTEKSTSAIGLLCGENIELSLSAVCNNVNAEWIESIPAGNVNPNVVNSLFSKRYADLTHDVVEVAYGRQLQNLDVAVSGIEGTTKLNVEQTKTIDFTYTTGGSNRDSWIDTYGSSFTFTPIINDYVDEYDGNVVFTQDGEISSSSVVEGIKGLKVDFGNNRAKSETASTETNRKISAGLFAVYFGASIHNVYCHSFNINYSRAETLTEQSTAVGCLIGRAKENVSLYRCKAYKSEVVVGQTPNSSTDKAMVGGFIGHAWDGADIQYCDVERSILLGHTNCCYCAGIIGFTCSQNYTPDVTQMDDNELIIKHCSITQSIAGANRSGGAILGGMVSYTFNKVIDIEDCIVRGVKFTSNSTGVAVIGGISGSPIATTLDIKNCLVYNSANDNARYMAAGIGNAGIYATSSLSLARSYVNSNATDSGSTYDARTISWIYASGGSASSEGSAVPIVSLGGIAGLSVMSNGQFNIEKCIASTVMYSVSNKGINGGIVGNGRSTNTVNIKDTIANCYLNGQYISGLASNLKSNACTFENCYSSGFLRCDGATKAAGLSTSRIIAKGCCSLINYDNIWSNVFSTSSLVFTDGYVSSYPSSAVPAKTTTPIYLMGGDNSNIDANSFYTYGANISQIQDQTSQTSNKSTYKSLSQLVALKGLQTEKTVSKLAPSYLSNNLDNAKIPLLIENMSHYGDWLERPAI